MMKKLFSAVLAFALIFTLSAPAFATEVPSILVDGKVLSNVETRVVNRTTYACYLPIVSALYPDATAVWEGDRAVVRADGLTLSIQLGVPYLVANGRYLYMKNGVLVQDGTILVPVRTLAQALGATVAWEKGSSVVSITSGSGAITPADSYYDAESLKWLSHIIYVESGNQPLAGKIAVGNVVLNRVKDPIFPSSIKEVVFQKSQFTPVSNGTIYLDPNPESIVAAKLCLDGANTVGNALYFVNPKTSPNSWASRNRPHVATIGAHAFFA